MGPSKFTYGQRVRLNDGFFNGCTGFVVDRNAIPPLSPMESLHFKYEVLLSTPDLVSTQYWVENAPAKKVWFVESSLEAFP